MTQALANIQFKPTELTTERLGEVLVKSGFFQDTRDIAQAIVKVLAGRELGFGPIASMQGVYIVKGRVTLSANLVGAAIQRSGKYRYRVTRLDNDGASLTFYAGSNEIGDSTFTMEDAKAAGIAGDTYKKFPRNMLFSRALTNGARWYCPEVFNGPVYTPDELGAEVDDEGQMVEPRGVAVVDDQPFVAQREAEVDDLDMVRSEDDKIWRNWLRVLEKAQGLGLTVEQVQLPIERDLLKHLGSEVLVNIATREQQLAADDANRKQAVAQF